MAAAIATRRTIERLEEIVQSPAGMAKKSENVAPTATKMQSRRLKMMDSKNVIPMVIETGTRGVERAFDIYSLLLRERIVMLNMPINDQVANVIISQLLYLDREDPDKDISLYIHSPGGSVTAGLAIYDTMQLIRPEVSTICLGMAASMATILLTAGAKGKRYALPHATIHMHQVSGRSAGTGG